MYVQEKHSIYIGLGTNHGFRHPLVVGWGGGLGTHSQGMRGDCCIVKSPRMVLPGKGDPPPKFKIPRFQVLLLKQGSEFLCEIGKVLNS